MSKKKRGFRYPLQAKAATIMIVLSTIIIAMAIGFYAMSSTKTNKENARGVATHLSSTVAMMVDTDQVTELKEKVNDLLTSYTGDIVTVDDWGSEEWTTYNEHFKSLYNEPSYIALLETVRGVANANTSQSNDVNCVYLLYIDHYRNKPLNIYLVDSTEEDQYPPATLETMLDENLNLFDDPTLGFAPFEYTSELDGSSITAGYPIYKGNEVIGYAMVDISVASIEAKQLKDIISLLVTLIVVTLVAAVIGFFLVRFIFVKPIIKLTKASSSYSNDHPEVTHKQFEELRVKTHDEVSDLADAMKTLEKDIHRQIEKLTKMNEELLESKDKTRAMTILATTDGLTGLRNKVAYLKAAEKIDSQIQEGKEPVFAIMMVDLNYLKTANDKFGHEAGDESLRILAKHLSEVFSRSPIYRVGGDEFVIVLRNHDLEHVESLIKDLYDRLDKSLNSFTCEPVSAAVGYALYDSKNDRDFDEVFRHADQAMYEKKHRMKKEKR